MNTQTIHFQILKHTHIYYFIIIIDNINKIECEFYHLYPNLKSLVNLLSQIKPAPITKPVYFRLDCYYHKVEFKLSPCPPMDWFILKYNDDIFYIDRLEFCDNLIKSIQLFLEEMNLDFFGNPKRPVDMMTDDELYDIVIENQYWLDEKIYYDE